MNPVNLCNTSYKGIESYVYCSKLNQFQEVGSPPDCDAQHLDVYSDKPFWVLAKVSIPKRELLR